MKALKTRARIMYSIAQGRVRPYQMAMVHTIHAVSLKSKKVTQPQISHKDVFCVDIILSRHLAIIRHGQCPAIKPMINGRR